MVTEWGHYIISLLLTAFFLLSAMSCSDRSGHIRSALAAADSLMSTEPKAALDTLMSIESSDAGKLSRADKAFYTLLHTEAEYKCYLPVAENTAIAEAADYYRRKGPEDRLARTLVMQGAVFSECSDPERAMLAYKEAEPIVERGGDPEQLGLLHTRIGELYQITYSDMSSAVDHYKSALRCFEEAGAVHRLAAANLTLSRILLPDSADTGKEYYIRGSMYAMNASDTAAIIESINQKALYLILHGKDTLAASELSKRAVMGHYGHAMPKAMFNSFCQIAVEGCLYSGDSNSASVYAGKMIVDDAVDSLRFFTTMAGIAELSDNWKQVVEYERTAAHIAERIERNAGVLALAEREAALDLRYAQLTAKYRTLWLYMIISVLVAASSLMVSVILRYRKSLSSMKRNIRDVTRRINRAASEEEDIRDDMGDTERFSAAVERMIDNKKNVRASTMRMSERTVVLIDRILSCCFKYQNPETFRRQVEELLRHSRSAVTDDAILFTDTIYPGFLDGLRQSYGLSERETTVAALIVCGFSGNGICLLLGLKTESLSVYKSNINRKLGRSGRLSDSLYSMLESHFS